jgi:glycosyltransferase involved in cell wall biosynthesis
MLYLPGLLKSLDGRFYAAAFERGLRLAAARERPRLIDAHFVWPDGVGAYHVARRLGVPFVCTIRGKLVSQIESPAKRRQIVRMLLGADRLIAVSRSLSELANRVADRDLGAQVIPNGLDVALFHRIASEGNTGPFSTARAALGWAENAKYAVSVGHQQALKGFDRLVELWPEVRRRMGDVRLVLAGGEAGEPAYERRLKSRIEAVGEGSVHLLGRVEPEQVARMLNAADAFVLASRSEGWCNAIAEALACGCPVVATDVGGNREIVNEPALGRLVPPGDQQALTDAVCSALEDVWDRAAIAASGGRRDWQQVARECADVFKSVAP